MWKFVSCTIVFISVIINTCGVGFIISSIFGLCPAPFLTDNYFHLYTELQLIHHTEEVPKPRIVEPKDVILRVTGSTICGSDLHLLHGTIVELQKGDILGHEFCGVVESVGPQVKNVKPGQRVVASFQIACGECGPCKKKQSSQCEKTNENSLAAAMYGTQTA
jgi:threonine dehydrogenase-like Zn-dependent dehydrogenase